MAQSATAGQNGVITAEGMRRVIFLKLKICTLLLVLLICPNYNRLYRKEINFIPYTVQAGDTLWDIAEGIDGDIRETVYLIRKHNGIDPRIYPGQVILIPAE